MVQLRFLQQVVELSALYFLHQTVVLSALYFLRHAVELSALHFLHQTVDLSDLCFLHQIVDLYVLPHFFLRTVLWFEMLYWLFDQYSHFSAREYVLFDSDSQFCTLHF